MSFRACAAIIVSCAVGCSSPAAESLEMDGADATIFEPLVVVDDAPVRRRLRLSVVGEDGASRDVSAEARFTVEDPALGHFEGSTFVAAGETGTTAIHATWNGQESVEEITVRAQHIAAVPSAIPEAARLFAAAVETPEHAPTVVYPEDGTVLPPTLDEIEVHWQGLPDDNLFQVVVKNELSEVITYVAAPRAAQRLVKVPLRRLAGPGTLEITVRGMSSSRPAEAGLSADVVVEVSEPAVGGTLYYYGASNNTVLGLPGPPSGIYRQRWGAQTAPEPFYTAKDAGTQCVGCHSLSRDGKRLALTTDVSAGLLTILDTATRTPVVAAGQRIKAAFVAFEPSGQRLLTADAGVLTLRDAVSGSALGVVPTSGPATQPDWSPRGDAIAYIRGPSANTNLYFEGGALVVQPFDAATARFGEPRELPVGSGLTVAYPSWSPDGQWLLFTSATGKSYLNPTAKLNVVRADGTLAPVALGPLDAGLTTDAWPRFAPFASQDGDERLFWFVFSSRRAYGVSVPQDRVMQMWMAPFYPDRAVADPEEELELTAAAFRVPFQDAAVDNYAAQWSSEAGAPL